MNFGTVGSVVGVLLGAWVCLDMAGSGATSAAPPAGATPTPVKGASFAPQRFALPEHGTLVLNVPTSWHAAFRTPPGAYPPIIGVTPAGGEKFELIVSVSWSKKAQTEAPRPEEVRVLIERTGQAGLAQAIEKTVKVKEFGSNGKKGYYITLTHKAPKPDQYRHMTQGAIGEGNFLLGFTLLMNNPKAVDQQSILAMLSNAKQERK